MEVTTNCNHDGSNNDSGNNGEGNDDGRQLDWLRWNLRNKRNGKKERKGK
ncbi:hypothetical protein A2U01_0105432, partial [Trifolium medium]|nr:hypothetical protein [Trifolium medium]